MTKLERVLGESSDGWRIEKERLSDGSFVYNVINRKDATLKLHVKDEPSAFALIKQLDLLTVD